MTVVAKVIGAFAVAALLLPVPSRADDQDVIAYRKHIMNMLNEQSAALGEILQNTVPDDNAVEHLEAIAVTASIALKAFEPRVEGGEAKPDVWNHWSDFAKRMNDFAGRTAIAARTARLQGKNAALRNILDALTCKSCHDVYRDEKEAP